MNRLFVFGLGYTAGRLARRRAAEGWEVAGTVRDPQAAGRDLAGVTVLPFDDPAVGPALQTASHLLVSAPPGPAGDPSLAAHGEAIAAARDLQWIGYLSTVGVYPDAGGDWVDETTPPEAWGERAARRVEAEARWQELGRETSVPVAIFRIAGIYGPGRNPLRQLAAGKARRIVRPGQVFNRIHVEDIATTVGVAMDRKAGGIFNVADDLPAPPQDVVAHAAELMGVAPPPEIPFDEADMKPMARSFYSTSKRVSNRRIREELGVRLAYPTYREGLAALFAAGEATAD